MGEFDPGDFGIWGPNGPQIRAYDVYETTDGPVEVPAGTPVEFVEPTAYTEVPTFEDPQAQQGGEA